MTRNWTNERVAIIGGGVAGLALGGALNRRGIDFQLFEANNQVGGLARTFNTGRFRWDLGVHALYSKIDRVKQLFHDLPIEYQYCHRDVKICHVYKNIIYPLDYPFENGLSGLPPEDLRECLEGYKEAKASGKVTFENLADWIKNGLGSGFSRVFMTPYNRKIWDVPLNQISMDLVAGKIEPEPYEKVLKCALGARIEGRSYQAAFLYPRAGIQEFSNYLASCCGGRIHSDMKLEQIETSRDGYSLWFANGESRVGYTRIVSTIPLKNLLGMIPWSDISLYAEKLHHNSTIFVMVGLKPDASFENFGHSHWSFYPGDEVFYRLTMMHNFSDMFPQACVAEHTVHGNKLPDNDSIIKKVVRDLLRLGILKSEADVQTISIRYEPCTYPIPTIGLRRTKVKISSFLMQKKIYLLGRSGNWDYINMDQVIDQVDAFLKKENP